MSSRSRDPSTRIVTPPQLPLGSPPRFEKKPYDRLRSIRQWIVVCAVANILSIATAQTISLIIKGPDIRVVTVQLLILNIVLVASMVWAMRQAKRRSTPFGPLVGRAYIGHIVFSVVAVVVLLGYAVAPIHNITTRDASSLARSRELVGGAIFSILYITSGLQVILATMLGLEQHMEIQRRRNGPALTQPGFSESEPQHLYVYQPAIPLRSDFTRTHYVGDEEDLANKDALPAYERQRPEGHPAVQIVDMAGSAIHVQDPPEPSTISPPDYDVAEVTSPEISHASTAAPVTVVGSEMRP